MRYRLFLKGLAFLILIYALEKNIWKFLSSVQNSDLLCDFKQSNFFYLVKLTRISPSLKFRDAMEECVSMLRTLE
jgi:hypothetical protein